MIPAPHLTDKQAHEVDPVPTDVTALADERRYAVRVGQKVSAQLIGLGCTRAVPCVIQNLAEGGLLVHASVDAGLGVGRRYEVVLDDDAVPAPLAGAMVAGCYATVVRTELLLDSPERLIGAGLRFDQPLLL